MSSVLIVEDEPLSGMSLEMELTAVGYDTTGIATTEDEAVELFEKTSPDIVLMDINLEQGGSGIDAAKKINQIKKVPVVFVTAYASDSIISQAGYAYPYGYVVKPYNIREIKAVTETALRRFEQEQVIIKSEAKLRTAMSAANLGVWELDPQSKRLIIDGVEYMQNFFSKENEISFDDFLALIVNEDREQIKQTLQSGQPLNQKIRVRTSKEQEVRWFEVYVSDTELVDSNVVIGALQDVTVREAYIQDIALSESIFNNMQQGVALLDANKNIVKANPALCEATGYTLDELIGYPFDELLKNSREADPVALNNDLFEQQQEITVRCKNGSHFAAIIGGSELSVRDQNCSVVIITNITDIKRANDRLAQMAFKDELTGLYNRSFMNRVLAKPKQYFSKGEFALIFIDLDSFKLINDNYGHMVGDKMLQQFAKRLSNELRESDFLIRHGGDEFIALINGCLDESALNGVIKSINHTLSSPFQIEKELLSMTCSIGISICQADAAIDDLLRHADIAMYEAKQSGRNSHRIYNPEFADKVKYQLFLEQGLRKAIEEERLDVWFQPIVDRHSNIVSYEALCRWRDDKAGDISPEKFIPIAERSWLIYPLGLFVFRKSCEFLSTIHKDQPNCSVNVNLSTKQISNVALPEVFYEITSEYGVSPKNITLEVTESALGNDNHFSIFSSLRNAGFRIALDDFGNGYSNLARLRQFPIDLIKLDKSLIQGRFRSADIRIICDAIFSMCRELGYAVVTEGIETEEHFSFFSKWDNAFQQGYYHGRPAPISEESLNNSSVK